MVQFQKQKQSTRMTQPIDNMNHLITVKDTEFIIIIFSKSNL